jgi:hypothetical protein
MALLPTLAEIYEMSRATLADVGGDVYTDTVLSTFVKRAYQKAGRYLRAQGMSLYRKESAAISVNAAVTSLARTGGSTYPADMIRPIEIREKVATDPATNYVAMRCQQGFIPADVAAKTTREYYDWIGDTVVFPAGTVNSTMQIQYEAYLPDPNSWITNPASTTLPIPEAGEAIAVLAAAYAFYSRDEKNNGDAAFGQALEDLQMIADAEARVKTAQAARYGRQ